MVEASEKINKYFEWIKSKTADMYAIANKARSLGLDPADTCEVSLAANMAERVVGLISVLAPQIAGSGAVERIIALEKEFGVLDWRVALSIAAEVAQQKYCKFDDEKTAIEIGIRTGFAYVTVGVVSSPLDGLIDITFKDRLDGGGKYFCLNFAGPIRNAGGTAASVCVIISDYVRKEMGYKTYDATEQEAKRALAEVRDYADRVAPRQHNPAEEEMMFLMKHMPVEISGDPSEKFEVSNYKDLPRIPTNILRSGFCLIMTDCIPLKSPKLWKQLNKWGHDFGMHHWDFLEEFIKIQKKHKAKGQSSGNDAKITPNYSYVKEIVAGRPVLGYPLRHGAFRLRYGRSRFSGYSAASIHPATMVVTQEFIGSGTQLKTERPGKAASMTMSDMIDGPIVKLDDDSVMQLHTLEQARSVADRVVEVIYLGDLLVAYGDFFNRAHNLIPAGYCEEWWIQELERDIAAKNGAVDWSVVAEQVGTSTDFLVKMQKDPIVNRPTLAQAMKMTKTYGTPFHPYYTPCFTGIDTEQFEALTKELAIAEVSTSEDGLARSMRVVLQPTAKRALELTGVDHVQDEHGKTIIGERYAWILQELAGKTSNAEKIFDRVQEIMSVPIRDKGGTFIGARMGRPEKAKARLIKGSPHALFPVGDEGGRMKTLQSALLKKKVNAVFQKLICPSCSRETIYRVCEDCNVRTVRQYWCRPCKKWQQTETCATHEMENKYYTRWEIPVNDIFKSALKYGGMNRYPDLVKGILESRNRHYFCEHPIKAVLRARHDINPFKDGTTRYDMTQIPMTHFKPKEVGTSVEKLRELGYEKDIHGEVLTRDDQILEMLPQDIVLPCGEFAGEEGADRVMLRVAEFINDLLKSMYKLDPYYKVEKAHDLVGELVICLAPHTSAGMLGRIIGFSATQGFWAHPFIHAATRRDCDGDEACVLLVMDAFLNFSREFLPRSRGGTMDAPLVLTSVLTPAEVDDMAFDVDVEWRYPLALYEAGLEYKKPWDVKIKLINDRLGTPDQFEGMGFTHDTTNMNDTVRCSAYKTVPSMVEKLEGQMKIAKDLRAVDTSKVATLVIEKHFMKDSAGNLRKFTMQGYRCVTCNTKYRRVPLIGKCLECNGKVIFTVSKGNITKYIQPTIDLAHKYNVSDYLKQSIELLQLRMEGTFGKEDKQTGLSEWF